ncbi:MAG: hypothetical protein QOE70_2431 [Chthoniobacter sp.]|jgi:hypothetical protein|nr:hypothetical protein [Chthoniobacter sp.]
MIGRKWLNLFVALAVNLVGTANEEKRFPLPDSIAAFFATQTQLDDGGLTGEENEKRSFRLYVCENWKTLLEHADELPRNQGQLGNTVGLIGGAAAQLDPTTYLEFVKKTIELAETGKIPRQAVFDQISGENKKNGFMTMNYADPRVGQLVKRAQALVPKDDDVTASWLKDLLSGELARPENFFSGNVSVNNGLPEKLPAEKKEGAARPSTPAATPALSTPVATATPAPLSPTPVVGKIPVPVVERKSPVWPWLVGIAALTVIALLVWKSRT